MVYFSALCRKTLAAGRLSHEAPAARRRRMVLPLACSGGRLIACVRSAMLARGPAVRDCLPFCARNHDYAAALPNAVGFTVVTVIPIDELRRSAMSALFEGGDDAPISFFVTEFPRGRGPDLHMHPYPEVLLVETGTALFTIAERQFTVSGEHVVVVPAHTPHGFKGAGDDTLRVVSVHSSGTVIQTDL